MRESKIEHFTKKEETWNIDSNLLHRVMINLKICKEIHEKIISD